MIRVPVGATVLMVLVLLGACGGHNRPPRIEDDAGRWRPATAVPGASEASRCGGSAGSALCGEALFPATRGNGDDGQGRHRRR